ncbi:hypothetical protein [Sinorhizobium medicae]
MAAEAGQLQLNAMEPVMIFSIHNAMELLKQAVGTFTRTCVVGVQSEPKEQHGFRNGAHDPNRLRRGS